MDRPVSAPVATPQDQPGFVANCIFCRIVAGEATATILHRDEHLMAIRDIHPAAPTHILIIPTRHISSLNDTAPHDEALLGEMMRLARSLAEGEHVADRGYRLVINTGPEAGQSVWHLHAHLLGGRRMAWPPG